MSKITKYSVYLSEQQARKVALLATTLGKEPEEVVNDAVYGYLAIATPSVEDREPPEDQHEILFYQIAHGQRNARRRPHRRRHPAHHQRQREQRDDAAHRREHHRQRHIPAREPREHIG